MLHRTLNILTLLCLLSLPGFSTAAGPEGAGQDRYTVFVSIQPQKYFVERVGGPFVDVGVLVPPGQSPETPPSTSTRSSEWTSTCRSAR